MAKKSYYNANRNNKRHPYSHRLSRHRNKSDGRGGWGPRKTVKHWTKRNINPFPARQNFTLKYCDVYQFTTNGSFSNYATEYDFRLGSLFDFDLSGSGHQAYGHDQIALIYKRYMVHDVKVKLEWFDPSTDGVVVGYCLMYQGSCNGMSVGELEEKPYSKLVSINNTGSQNAYQEFTVSNHTLLGLKKEQYRNNEVIYGSDFGGSPTLGPYLRCVYMHPGATGATVRLKITALFNVECYQPNMLAQS